MLISSIYSLNLLFSMTKPSLVSFRKLIWYLYCLIVFWRFSFSESMHFPSWNEEASSNYQGIFSFLKIASSSSSCWSATATGTFWDLSPLILEYFDCSTTLFLLNMISQSMNLISYYRPTENSGLHLLINILKMRSLLW